jgi:hypothetical protein
VDNNRGFKGRRVSALLPMILASGAYAVREDAEVPLEPRPIRIIRRPKGPKMQRSGSKYRSHQGKKECARRRRQMEKMAAKAA